MKKSSDIKRVTVFFALTLLSGPLFSMDATDKYSPLSIHGIDYVNACILSEKKDLQLELLKNKVPKITAAWALMELMLCSPLTDSNKIRMREAVLPSLRIGVESTGEDSPTIKIIKVDSDIIEKLFAQGEAWRARLSMADNLVRLRYFSNESCIEERAIKYTKGSWKLSEYGQACD